MRHAILLAGLAFHGQSSILPQPAPFGGIETFFGLIAPFTLDSACMSHWECADYKTHSRDSCGTLEAPCAARIRGDIGDSIFDYWFPGYMKNELLDGHVCGSVYEVNYFTGTEPIYVVIADIQPGYVTIQDQDSPGDSPWVHLKDSWMPDTWNKKAEVKDYLEIEAAGWNAMSGTNPWEQPCHEVTEDDMSPPAGLPHRTFDAKLVSYAPNRRHNNDEMYQSKSFVRWLNYLRGLHGIPLPFSWHDGLAESQEEHVDALAAGHRIADADGPGRNERIEFANTVAPALHPDYVEERVFSSSCSNCPRQFVKMMVNVEHKDLLLPWSYVGFWCASLAVPSRKDVHIQAVCSFMLGAKTPEDKSGWEELVDIDTSGTAAPQFTTTTTTKPHCTNFEFGPTIRFVFEATTVTEPHLPVWDTAWASMLSQWSWWLAPLPDLVEIEDWGVPRRFYTELVTFSDKGKNLECGRTNGFIQLDDRAHFMRVLREITFDDAGGPEVKKSQMDALYRAASSGGGWDESSTVVLFTMSPYNVDDEGKGAGLDPEIPTHENGHDHLEIQQWNCQHTVYGNVDLLIQTIWDPPSVGNPDPEDDHEGNRYKSRYTSFVIFTDQPNLATYEGLCAQLEASNVNCRTALFDPDTTQAADIANTLLEIYHDLECLEP